MKVIVETRTGSRWTFSSLKKAKEAGAVKNNVRLTDGMYDSKLKAVVIK